MKESINSQNTTNFYDLELLTMDLGAKLSILKNKNTQMLKQGEEKVTPKEGNNIYFVRMKINNRYGTVYLGDPKYIEDLANPDLMKVPVAIFKPKKESTKDDYWKEDITQVNYWSNTCNMKIFHMNPKEIKNYDTEKIKALINAHKVIDTALKTYKFKQKTKMFINYFTKLISRG